MVLANPTHVLAVTAAHKHIITHHTMSNNSIPKLSTALSKSGAQSMRLSSAEKRA